MTEEVAMLRPQDAHALRGRFPTLPPEHTHAQALLANALRYLAPESGTTDVSSGYPVEGWNNEPERGLGLRSFTQLTAIGEWLEVLGNLAAGAADAPQLTREQALERLQHAVASLRQDQQDPQVSSRGLMGNFLDLDHGRRIGPLVNSVERQRFVEAFGPEQAKAIWQALEAKGWIRPTGDGSEAIVLRPSGYGVAGFDGPLSPFADEATQTRIMAILDRRTVTVVYGDNANLTMSVANTIGALLSPSVATNPTVVELRAELEHFLEAQQPGYRYLYDTQAGQFFFGWDANRNRWLGWQDGNGTWQAGHMDYLVNEFRGPTGFIVTRFGLPAQALGNLAFQMKPYRTETDRELYVLAPWDGSAFQAWGLGLAAAERQSPSWYTLLKHAVTVELDYARRHRLPGFLSESYIGEGARYTGEVGIPEIAATAAPRLTHIASLYTLGVAYAIAPTEVEPFLADNWATISPLLTEHGPWEGFDVVKQEPVRVQTTAHTLSLALGLLATGPANMVRYLDSKGLRPRLEEIYQCGKPLNLLGDEQRCFAWANAGDKLTTTRQSRLLRVESDRAQQVAMAFASPRREGMNLSGGSLRLAYRSSQPIGTARLELKTATSGSSEAPLLTNQVTVHLIQTTDAEGETEVPLPATPGLNAVREVVLQCEPTSRAGAVDLSITRLEFTPSAEVR